VQGAKVLDGEQLWRALSRRKGPFFLISGPCVIENPRHPAQVAARLKKITGELGIPFVFKASYDKANRSSLGSYRGPGIERGLEILAGVRAKHGVPILTDVHEVEQVERAAAVADVLQIPAFLCRQTDLLIAAGETGCPVNVKKGQWMAPEEMKGAVAKLRGAGAAGVATTERGTFFGYGNLVVDMRSFALMREACGAPVIFDGTHSVQRPGMGGGISGGEPRFIPPLVRAAAAAGVDALFLETHPEPAKGLSDTTNMLPLDQLKPLIRQVLAIREVLAEAEAERV